MSEVLSASNPPAVANGTLPDVREESVIDPAVKFDVNKLVDVALVVVPFVTIEFVMVPLVIVAFVAKRLVKFPIADVSVSITPVVK